MHRWYVYLCMYVPARIPYVGVSVDSYMCVSIGVCAIRTRLEIEVLSLELVYRSVVRESKKG